ncbi:MAG TPA: capsule biosynthesis protein, partial [Methylocella sp.]|nr:capsule biosynthesis protein [Methylocella sp.]
YERARQESERQHIYFMPFVEPVKPAVAEYPLRARKIAFTGLCALAFWSVLALAWAGIRDHRFER